MELHIVIGELISRGHLPVLLSTAGDNLLDFLQPGHSAYESTVNQINSLADKLKISFAEAAAMHGFEIGALADYVVE